MIFLERYEKIAFSQDEALRYLGYGNVPATAQTLALLEEMRLECEGAITPALCYTELPLSVANNTLTLGEWEIESEHLSRALSGCERVILFACTVGVGVDRLLVKYSRTDALKATVLQAVGATFVEGVCEKFCSSLAQKYPQYSARPRFSPGYGDLRLSVQRRFFELLAPEGKIGLTLNSSLLMSPSKSVTAFVGLKRK